MKSLMDEYRAAKERHPDMILLFRMGDFYEAFGQDATDLAKVCGLTTMQRDGAAMAGFPHHSLETYLQKLLRVGRRVAICDQVTEAPPATKVERVIVDHATQDYFAPRSEQGTLYSNETRHLPEPPVTLPAEKIDRRLSVPIRNHTQVDLACEMVHAARNRMTWQNGFLPKLDCEYIPERDDRGSTTGRGRLLVSLDDAEALEGIAADAVSYWRARGKKRLQQAAEAIRAGLAEVRVNAVYLANFSS